jgi:outer membrane murein-binding lipoprotein Lpp
MIHVTFQAGTVQTELTASAQGGTMMSGGAWSKAAGKIAKQVKEWISANRAQLEVKP